jgi:hypothetical protein
MLNLKSFGKYPDGSNTPWWKAFDGQQSLMLMWLKLCFSGCALAKIQETSNLITKIS